MAAIKFTTDIRQFPSNKQTSGWTYIELSPGQAKKLSPESRLSFRVKGTLDKLKIEKQSVLPMRDGSFILTLNARLRKALGKMKGDKLTVSLEVDERKIPLSADLVKCLKDDPEAMKFFKSLTSSHQHYFSTWIESAKTMPTKTRRIVMTLTALGNKQGYGEMLQSKKNYTE